MGKEEFIQELTFKNSRFVNDISAKLSNLDEKFNDFLSKYNKVNSELQQCQKINSHLRIIQHQCITLRQRTVRYHLCTLVHYSCALLFAYFTIATFFMLHLFSFCFMLQLLHVALFCVAVASCCTFSKMHFFILYSFQVALFSCYNLFMLHLFCVLHSFHVAHVLCCTFSVLHIFYIVLFSSCTFFVLYTFRVALFRVALLFFMLHSFHVAHFFVLHRVAL